MAFQHSLRDTINNRHIIHKRLQRRLILFPIISLCLIIFVAIDAYRSNVPMYMVLISLAAGLGIGYGVGMIYKIYWREDQQKIVSGIDRLTVVLIIGYVAFRIGTDQLLDQFVHGETLIIVTLSILAGILTGRMVAVLRKVARVLHSKAVMQHIKKSTSYIGKIHSNR